MPSDTGVHATPHMPPMHSKENPTLPASLHDRKKGVERRAYHRPLDEPRDLAIVLPLHSPNISAPGKPHQLCFYQRYDIRICLYGKNGAVYSKWEALTNFLLKLQGYDRIIQLHPWRVTDHNCNNPAIEISSIPNAFFDLHRYVPRLANLTASWTTRAELGRTRHPYMFFSSSVSPAHLVKKWGLGCR